MYAWVFWCVFYLVLFLCYISVNVWLFHWSILSEEPTSLTGLYILVPKQCLILGSKEVHAVESWSVDRHIHQPYVKRNINTSVTDCSNFVTF